MSSASQIYHEAEQLDEIRNLVESTISAKRSLGVGRIEDYNPDYYAVKVRILPQLGSNGAADITGWIPLLTPWAGPGWGMTVAPVVNSQSPKLNPLTLLLCVGDPYGMMVAVGLFYNNLIPPVSTPAGELNLQHSSGTHIHLGNDSSALIRHKSGKEILIDADGAIHIYSDKIEVGEEGGSFEKTLLGETFLKLFNNHQHFISSTVSTGAVLVPTQMTAAQLTKNVKVT